MHSIPPRITEKSYRLRVSNRTMVGVLEPPRFACVASGTEGVEPSSYETVEQTPSIALVCREARREHKASPDLEIGLDANRHIHLLSERTEGIFSLTSPLIGLIDRGWPKKLLSDDSFLVSAQPHCPN